MSLNMFSFKNIKFNIYFKYSFADMEESFQFINLRYFILVIQCYEANIMGFLSNYVK